MRVPIVALALGVGVAGMGAHAETSGELMTWLQKMSADDAKYLILEH